ncbi:uncharacterized protein LOC125231378 [Leguminivora glycinivorella]|uniref:uncharacterized protein LOC125231378 n=1 Tax=Leguminivora glycinivorella TaxID=1035111 RepID=UPI00200E1852|nr:uncharacterized protein LOC125231378 [Leguminivora glycinivorella]
MPLAREAQKTYITLVKHVKRYPALYDYNLQDYSNKTITDELWIEIAKKTNSTVHECKERWRNIRSSFIRSMKGPTNGSRSKKVYYLAEHLQFLLPHLKFRHKLSLPLPCENEELESIDDDDKESQDYNFEDDKSDCIEDEEDEETLFTGPSITDVVSRKRRISADETSRETVKSTSTHPMNYFFRSLLDEFETMDEGQIRQFKIRVLQLIDDIKASKKPFEVTSSTKPSNIGFQSSASTSRNAVAYATKQPDVKKNTQTVDPLSSSTSKTEFKAVVIKTEDTTSD